MNKSNTQSLLAISSAALLLPGISAQAENISPKWQLSYQYSLYAEDSLPASKLLTGSDDRYEVTSHLLGLRAPLNETTDVKLSILQETLSGATPWYVQPNGNELLQVMSGASIAEERTEISLDFGTKYAKSDMTLSLGHSTENDYKSFSGGLSGNYQFASWLSMNWGFNYSSDYIDAIDSDIYTDRPSEESKKRLGTFLGFSYAMGKTTLINFTSSYAFLDGYLADPYKLVLVGNATVQDSRPDSNQQVANNLLIRQFIPSLNAAVHLDYRYFINDWIFENANTINLAWYQNIGDSWMFIPSVRFYDQPASYFYRPYFNSTRNDGYYSSDYRLSAFEATSFQLKLEKTFSSFKMSLSHETYEATGDHPGLISYGFTNFNVVKTF